MIRSFQPSQKLPQQGRGRLRVLIAALAAGFLLAFATSANALDPKPAPPELTFSFESLNIPALSPNFIGAGASMMTLHFVDASHVLVTYSLRELVPRLVGDAPEDDDRLVGAELIDLLEGHVLARTRWHLHDHGRYLWSLGNGRFLLRAGDDISTFAPLANLGTADAFKRTAMPHRPGILDAVIVSSDGKLLTLETHKPEKKKLVGIDINILTSGDRPPAPTVFYDFYRLSGAGSPDSPLHTARAGTAQAMGILRMPINGDGYLLASGGKRGRWNIEFESFGGAKTQLVGVVESNCRPGLELVSPTQYLAFTCRSAHTDGVTVAAYDFAKNDIWEEPMGSFDTYAPVFAFAPTAGRFAISRKIDTPAPGIANDPTGNITTQEVRVYGTQTGDLLMKTYCVPVFRTSENFDLSPDGMRLGVVRNGSVEIYRLPELTKLDRQDLAELAKLTPPPGVGPVNLHRIARDTASDVRESEAAADADEVPTEDKTTVGSTAAAMANTTGPATPTGSTNPAASSNGRNSAGSAARSAATDIPPTLASDGPGPTAPPSGDIQVRRKPPTLLNPGETPEGQKPTRKPDNQ